MVLVALFLLFAFLFSACDRSAPANISANAASASVNTSTTGVSQPATNQQTSVTDAHSVKVKVYFSRLPQSNNNFNAVFPVNRVSPTSSVDIFVVQQLIVGPTVAEEAAGYESELKGHLSGPSNCAASANFTLKLNTKGSISQTGTATLKFCRLFSSAGIGTDARASAEISTTLKQFTTIKKVVILTKDAHCFGDESGADLCLS
jgi:hypothetical protein